MSDTANERCPDCGGVLRARGTRRVCPRCLLAGTVGSDSSAASPPADRPDLPSVEELAPAFPDLEILRFVGAGGMGVVYEARQKSLDRPVALKLLKVDTVNPEFVERFQREGKTLAKLDHPNIVRIFEQGDSDDWVFILMEFVDGTDLSQLLEQGEIPTERALEIADSLCAALEYAHAEGVIHRDIKPANILIDASGAVKIADFGLAKLAGPDNQNFTLTTGGSSMGTPLYMAPEQRKDSAGTDARADIYSAGVVLYEMLTGELPVGRVKAPSLVSATPRFLDKVVLRAIEPEPDDRHPTVTALRESLLPQKSRAGAIAAAAAGAALIASVGFAALREKPPEPLPLLKVADAVHIKAPVPAAEDYFGAIISAGGDILAVTDCRTNPLMPLSLKSGGAAVYQIAEDGTPSAPVVFRPKEPSPADRYGHSVSVSRDGNWLAISAPNQKPPPDTEEAREGLEGAIEIYRRAVPDSNAWELEDIVYTPEAFGSGLFLQRLTIHKEGLLAVGSLGFPGDAGVIIFRRGQDGTWAPEDTLTPGPEYSGSGFAHVSKFSGAGDELLVSAAAFPSADGKPGGRIARFLYDSTTSRWNAAAPLSDPNEERFANFGGDVAVDGDRMITSVPGNPIKQQFAPGALLAYERDPAAPAGWGSPSEINLPPSESARIAFGFRIGVHGDLMAATAYHGDITDVTSVTDGFSTTTVYQYQDEWRPVATISGEGDGVVFLGRVAIGDHFIAMADVAANFDELEDAGIVYIFPSKNFPAIGE